MANSPERWAREPWAAVRQRLLSSGAIDFASLVKLAGLDPARHMRFAEWSGVDFEGSVLAGFNFIGARLIGCSFKGAWIKGGCFEHALIDVVRPYGTLDSKRTSLCDAEDWDAYVGDWLRAPNPPPDDDHLRVGAVFQDAPFAPEMVVVPPGEFLMGTSAKAMDAFIARHGEQHRQRVSREGPQHNVSISYRLAVGRFPVTFGEWDVFVGGKKVDRMWSKRPVINIKWNDALAYVEWLAKLTGKAYRLLSEAEWEYCCRAGTTTAYATGEGITRAQAQFSLGRLRSAYLTEVGTFPANAWGLYDMHGNVWEWCKDNWHEDYSGAPDDGSAWNTPASYAHVIRGGCWQIRGINLRSARRSSKPSYYSESPTEDVGFRVVRTLAS